MAMIFCRGCGKEIHDTAPTCPHCGAPQVGVKSSVEGAVTFGGTTDKEWLTTLLLALFLGVVGVHRFYTGKTGTGILMLLTFGGCGIWALYDIIMIAMGSFKDGQGRLIKKN